MLLGNHSLLPIAVIDSLIFHYFWEWSSMSWLIGTGFSKFRCALVEWKVILLFQYTYNNLINEISRECANYKYSSSADRNVKTWADYAIYSLHLSHSAQSVIDRVIFETHTYMCSRHRYSLPSICDFIFTDKSKTLTRYPNIPGQLMCSTSGVVL